MGFLIELLDWLVVVAVDHFRSIVVRDIHSAHIIFCAIIVDVVAPEMDAINSLTQQRAFNALYPSLFVKHTAHHTLTAEYF